MKRWRPESVGGMIQQEISEIIRNMKDPRIGFVTVTGVEMSHDLRNAKVFVSVLGGDQVRKDTIAALEHGAAFIRRAVGQRIQIRYTPEILFRYDDSMEYGAKIDRLLSELQTPPKELRPEETRDPEKPT